MRFSNIAAVTALLTVTAADAQNVRAPVSTDPGGTDSSVETRARKETLRRTPLHRHPRECEHPYCSQVIITTEDAIASTSKPLGPKARATLKLPKLQGCTVSVTASFEGGGQVDVGEFDICKDKTIRFTD